MANSQQPYIAAKTILTHGGPLNAGYDLTARFAIYALCLFAVLLCATVATAAELTSTVDRHTVGADETLQLRVRYNDQAVFGEPDFSALNHQFEILSTSRQQQINNINGRTESYTDWYVTLLPKKNGTLIIPSFKFKGTVSNAIEIEVIKSKTPSQITADNPVFLETEVDKETVYTQEQVLLTYRLYMATPLKNIGMSELQLPSTEIVKVAETTYNKQINDMQLSVIELRFALFPQNSGELVIPQIRFTGYLPRGSSFFDNFYRNGKRFTLRGEKRQIKVEAKPNSVGGNWLPAREVRFEEQWSGNEDEWHVGEPLTRTITITALGATSSQLPEITLDKNSKYRVYPDQAKQDQTTSPYGVLATRTESIAVVPSEPGALELPPITLQWWDTQRHRMETAVLEGRTLNVLPAPQQAYTPALPEAEEFAGEAQSGRPQPTVQGNTLLWVSLAGNVLLLALVVVFARRGRHSARQVPKRNDASVRMETEGRLFTAIKEAANNRQPQALREALLNWARHYWKREAITTLERIGSLIGDAGLRKHLEQLDQALYGRGNQQPDYAAIGNAIKMFRANGRAESSQPVAALKPLYPQ